MPTKKLLALVMLVLSACPYTAPFSVVGGRLLDMAMATSGHCFDCERSQTPDSGDDAAFCVPSLRDDLATPLRDALPLAAAFVTVDPLDNLVLPIALSAPGGGKRSLAASGHARTPVLRI